MLKKETLVEQEKKREDLGFGTAVTDRNTRLIRNDGKFNIKRIGQSFDAQLNLYHRLVVMSRPKFIILIFGFYIIVNVFFANAYLLLGIDHLQGPIDDALDTPHAAFWKAFFFSAQTLTTVGYGHISPIGFETSMLASIESLVGLMFFALITGLLYGRFSRPSPKIRFSTNALIAPYLDVNAFMFRMVNEKSNQLIDVTATLVFSKIEDTKGIPQRKYHGLTLERNKVNFFPTHWTLVHAITEDSPLYKATPETLIQADAEFMISISAIDDTFSEQVNTRVSYTHKELVWGAKFTQMLHKIEGEEGYILDLGELDNFEKRPLN